MHENTVDTVRLGLGPVQEKGILAHHAVEGGFGWSPVRGWLKGTFASALSSVWR